MELEDRSALPPVEDSSLGDTFRIDFSSRSDVSLGREMTSSTGALLAERRLLEEEIEELQMARAKVREEVASHRLLELSVWQEEVKLNDRQRSLLAEKKTQKVEAQCLDRERKRLETLDAHLRARRLLHEQTIRTLVRDEREVQAVMEQGGEDLGRAAAAIVGPSAKAAMVDGATALLPGEHVELPESEDETEDVPQARSTRSRPSVLFDHRALDNLSLK